VTEEVRSQVSKTIESASVPRLTCKPVFRRWTRKSLLQIGPPVFQSLCPPYMRIFTGLRRINAWSEVFRISNMLSYIMSLHKGRAGPLVENQTPPRLHQSKEKNAHHESTKLDAFVKSHQSCHPGGSRGPEALVFPYRVWVLWDFAGGRLV